MNLPTKPKKILIRAPNWIGDGVLSIPAIEVLKRVYPHGELTVITRPWVSPIYFNNPFVDRVMDYDVNRRYKGISGRFKLVKDIKKEDFDLVFLFQNSFEAALLTSLAGIPGRVGYDKNFRGSLLSHPVRIDPKIGEKHQVFYYFDLLKAFGIEVTTHPRPELYLAKEEEEWGRGFLAREGLEGKSIVGLAPGASYGPAKRWRAERFAEVAERLIDDYKTKVIVFGDEGDKDDCQEIVKRIGDKALNLTGRTTLRQFISLVNLCSLLVTNDSGPMHISAALGVPTVAIFGSTDPVVTGPLSENFTVIKRDVECSPCFKRTCHEGDYRCLEEITVEDVLKVSFRIMDEGGMGDCPHLRWGGKRDA